MIWRKGADGAVGGGNSGEEEVKDTPPLSWEHCSTDIMLAALTPPHKTD